MKLFKKLFGSQAGVAVDELILATTMVAGIGTFTVAAMNWDSFSVSSTSIVHDQMVSQLKQVEEANYNFYVTHRMWPHQTTDGDWANNASALVTPSVMRYPYRAMTTFNNLLPNFTVRGRNYNLRHGFGKGGNVMQRPIKTAEGTFIEVIFENIPFEDAKKIDAKIDGKYNPTAGRVMLEFSENEKVSLHYLANKL